METKPLIAPTRGYNGVRHQECGDIRDDIHQFTRIMGNVFNKRSPLPLLLLILGKCFR